MYVMLGFWSKFILIKFDTMKLYFLVFYQQSNKEQSMKQISFICAVSIKFCIIICKSDAHNHNICFMDLKNLKI